MGEVVNPSEVLNTAATVIMCVGEQAPKSSKYDFSKIYIQNYKNQKFLGRVRWVRWVRWVRQLVEASKSISHVMMLYS